MSAEETQFLGSNVVGVGNVTYADVDTATAVVIAGLEPEEECPILFLRLRKQVEHRGLPVTAVAPFAARGFEKLSANVVATVPGREAEVLSSDEAVAAALATERALIIVGERLATSPGALSAAAELADRTGAKLAWVPRRAGDRGAVEAGCLPTLLPGGRPVADAAARAEMASEWDLAAGVLPSAPGRDTDGIVAAAASGKLRGLLIAGVDPGDLADPRLADDALDNVDFLVSLEVRMSPVTRRADVVLPVAPVAEKPGTFVDWEGRTRTFERSSPRPRCPTLACSTHLPASSTSNSAAPTWSRSAGKSAVRRRPRHRDRPPRASAVHRRRSSPRTRRSSQPGTT